MDIYDGADWTDMDIEDLKASIAAGRSIEEAAEFLSDMVIPGDLLLVKGSRGVKMERIVEALLARYAGGVTAAERVRH